MSKRTNNKNRNTAMAAYRLKNQGLTNAQIAEQMGIDVKKVPDMVKRGERFSN